MSQTGSWRPSSMYGGHVKVNNQQAMVRQFHHHFGCTIGHAPALRDIFLASELIQEEAEETINAILRGDFIETIDGLCDLLYVTYGAGIRFGVDLEPFFAEVHKTNMAKVGGATREDGKILKPEGWQKPDIAGILEREVRRGEDNAQRT